MSLFDELKRRKVIRVAVGYIVAAWVFAQVADLVADNFLAPPWVMQMIIALLVVGLPVAVILSWIFDLTPDGIVRSVEIDSSKPALSDAQTYGILGVMFAAVVLILYLIWPQTSSPTPEVTANSIAVLPFENDSMAEENAEFFASGMHDELLNRLADMSGLKVISRTSVMAYQDTTKNARQIGEELGVVYLLEGRVQRAGDRLRIIVQLIDSTSDDHVWQDDYDRELTAENIFAVQAEMATSIATQLHQTISPEMTARLDARPTDSTRAYEFYLSGEEYLRRRRADVAIEQFERAIEEDPVYATAWAALSRAHSRAYWDVLAPIDEHLEKARNAAATAFELSPDLPEAHFALGYFYMYVTREHEKSLAELAIAERGMPGSSDLQQTIGFVQRRSGNIEASIATTSRAIELDPRNTPLIEQQAENYADVHDAARFHRHLDRVLEIEPDSVAVPGLRLRYGLKLGDDLAELRMRAKNEDSGIEISGNWFHDHFLLGLFERDYEGVIRFLDQLPNKSSSNALRYGHAYQLAGQPELAEPNFAAAREMEERRVADPNRVVGRSRALMRQAMATAGLGEFDEAIRLAEEALAMNFPDEPMITKGALINSTVGVFIPAGEHDRAIELLDEHFATPVGWTIEGLSPHPLLDPIRDHPGWLALVEKYGRE